MYCRSCGIEISDDSKFCYNCGQEIEVPNAAKIIETPKSPKIPKPIEATKPINIPTPIKAPQLPIISEKSQIPKPIKASKQNTPPLPKMSSTYKKKKHGFGKFMKIVVISLLSVPVLVLITLLVVTISKNSFQKSDTAKNIDKIESGKNIERIIIEDKDDSGTTVSDSEFFGVWKLSENRTNPDNPSAGNNIYEYNPSNSETYAVIMNHKLYNVSYSVDGVQISNVILDYNIHDDYIISGFASDKLPENAYLKLIISTDNELMIYMIQDDKAITDYSVYEKTQIEPNELAFPIQPKDDNTLVTPVPTPNSTVAPTPNPTLEPTKDSSVELKEYTVPTYETDTPIYTVILDNTWELVGFADNPNKLSDDFAKLTLEELNGYMLWFVFYDDESMLWMEDNQGEYLELELFYEIMDTHFIDTYPFEDGTGMRFYLGNDGLLYMCEYEGDENHSDFSDFYVLKPLVS